MDDGFIIIIIALQDCGSPFYAIAGYEAKSIHFLKLHLKSGLFGGIWLLPTHSI